MIVYGIKNCNTVKKATNHLSEKNIEFKFHDYKKSGISKEKLQEWSKKVGWETLINKKGTTWRKLGDSQKEKIQNENDAIELMINHTSLIKRPVIEKDGEVLTIGFDEGEFSDKFT